MRDTPRQGRGRGGREWRESRDGREGRRSDLPPERLEESVRDLEVRLPSRIRSRIGLQAHPLRRSLLQPSAQGPRTLCDSSHIAVGTKYVYYNGGTKLSY